MNGTSADGPSPGSAGRGMGRAGKTPPRALPVMRAHVQMRRNPLQFMLDTVRRYGDIMRIDLGFHRAYLLARPDFIKYVLPDHRKNFSRGPAPRWLKTVWGAAGSALGVVPEMCIMLSRPR